MAKKYTSIRRVIEKVFRDNGYTTEIDFYDALEWVAEAMGLIGVNLPYDQATVNINIVNYRGKMPKGWLKIIGTRDADTKRPYRYETSSFFHNCHTTDSVDLHCNGDLTYKVSNNYIFSSKETGCIEMSVLQFPVDEEGFPKVPDDVKYVRALASYIRHMADYKLHRQGKLSREISDKSEQSWLFDVGAAGTSARIMSVDEMESFKNQVLSLIPQPNEHSNGFGSLGAAERRYNN